MGRGTTGRVAPVVALTLLASSPAQTSCATNRAAATRAVPPPAIGEAPEATGDTEVRYVSSQAYLHYLRGLLHRERGETADAVEELRLALVYDPESPHLRVELARLHQSAGNLEKAVAEVERALEHAPDHVPALMLRAELYLRGGDGPRARELLRRAATLAPDNLEAYDLLAGSLREAGDEAAVVGVLAERVRRNPDRYDGYLNLARAYLGRGDLAAAREQYLAVLKTRPVQESAVAGLITIARRQRDWETGIAVVQGALRHDGSNVQWLYYAGVLLLGQGDLPAAEAYFNQCIGIAGEDPRTLPGIIDAYVEADKLDEGLRYLRALRALHPDDVHVQVALGRALYLARRYDEALADLGSVPPDHPLWLQSRRLISYSLRDLGRHGGAIDVLSDALRHAPEDATLYDDLARVYERAGRTADAIGLLRAAIAQNPEDEGLHYALGSVYERSGDAEKALSEMGAILRINPKNVNALNFIGYTLAEQGTRLDEAEALVKRAIMLSPGDGYITDSLGWVFYRQGRYDLALDALTRANNLSPGEPVILDHVGDAYRALGRRDEAIRAYEAALQANPDAAVRAQIEKKLSETRAGRPAPP